jgi:hypothetical protein
VKQISSLFVNFVLFVAKFFSFRHKGTKTRRWKNGMLEYWDKGGNKAF